jgi:hypothetical protein
VILNDNNKYRRHDELTSAASYFIRTTTKAYTQLSGLCQNTNCSFSFKEASKVQQKLKFGRTWTNFLLRCERSGKIKRISSSIFCFKLKLRETILAVNVQSVNICCNFATRSAKWHFVYITLQEKLCQWLTGCDVINCDFVRNKFDSHSSAGSQRLGSAGTKKASVHP